MPPERRSGARGRRLPYSPSAPTSCAHRPTTVSPQLPSASTSGLLKTCQRNRIKRSGCRVRRVRSRASSLVGSTIRENDTGWSSATWDPIFNVNRRGCVRRITRLFAETAVRCRCAIHPRWLVRYLEG